MESFKVAILGCGTVGGGVAKILLDESEQLTNKAGKEIELTQIVDLFPKQSSERHRIPIKYYCGTDEVLTTEQASQYIEKVLKDDSIDLIVETIGGSGQYIQNLSLNILNHKKHLVNANKALLAEHGKAIFKASQQNNRSLGFEASVCGAIPIIRTITEGFTGDEILSISGIMNGTSNYILSKMETENQSFDEALKNAQEQGYAEADPELDISGGDAGHKLTILLRLVFGVEIDFSEVPIKGIEYINRNDLAFAQELDCSIKLICYAKKEDKRIYATVRPMMVKKSNLLSKIEGATNAVRLINKYSKENILIGQGAGSLETGSSIVADIVFLAKYGSSSIKKPRSFGSQFHSFDDLQFPYNITFETDDIPGITGIVATAIGKQSINIDTVSHNRHSAKRAIFSIATMPCTNNQIREAIEDIKRSYPNCLSQAPKITPILQG